MAILALTGTHGTTVANAEKIKVNGFKASIGSGAIRGTAAYFWAYLSHIELGKNLALAWCRKGNDNGNCAAIFCSITCDESSYFDFEDIAVREGFLKFVDRLNKSQVQLTHSEMNELYDAYFAFLESSNGVACDVIRTKIWFKNNGVYSRQILGDNPDCYVVKNLDSISVQSIIDEDGNSL
jgi:hypothetical protein